MLKSLFTLLFISLCFCSAVSQDSLITNHSIQDSVILKVTNEPPVLSTTGSPIIKSNIDKYNFGSIPEGFDVYYDFTLTNVGNGPLLLQSVNASCGCTVPTFSKEPIAPGQSTVIGVKYNTNGRPGSFEKTLTIISNAPTKVLTLVGRVEAKEN